MSPEATSDEIKKAYRKLARKWHPDVNPAPEAEAKFKELATAFETVGDPVRRRAHDATLGRVARGELPEEFVDHVMSAIERAQRYAEEVVVPHYAGLFRGQGAEMAARLWHDLDSLADPTWLAARPGLLGRRRAGTWLAKVHVTMETWPTGTLSTLQRTFDGHWAISLTPWALMQAGFTDSADIDDAILRILLTRYAQVLSIGRFQPPPDPEAWQEALAEARARDSQISRALWAQRAVYAAVAAVLVLMLYAGFTGL